MALSIGNKTFMNLQEAVGWLLENNALPFQSTANYAGGVEIAMSTLINPSPAKVRVGSLIFFADSKVSTVVGVTSNSFICSDQYNDLVDDVVYVSNVALNGSGHLIVTLSNGDTIDAGLIKQVSNFSINGSQHLIVTYNDGSTTDLGPIFSGNVNINGNITASGTIDGDTVTGNLLLEKMGNYYFTTGINSSWFEYSFGYVGVVKTGNKITFAVSIKIKKIDANASNIAIGTFGMPYAVANKLIPITIGGYSYLDQKEVSMFSGIESHIQTTARLTKSGNEMSLYFNPSGMVLNTDYVARYEVTFLLSDPLNS